MTAIMKRLLKVCVQHKICITTTIAGGQAICEALKFGPEKSVRRLQDLHAGIKA